ncbi:MAG: hypothetical protein K0R60_2029 [Microbacterium sp.]|jgi:hypothetical protein|nr:hypothetical protein [Microbacterium sp.]
MHATHPSSTDVLAVELLPVSDSGWIACDQSLGADDPRRVIAYLDCCGRDINVTWVRERREGCSYETLGDALQAMSCSLHDER